MANVLNIEFEAGFITVTFDSGPKVQYPIKDVLRAADIPALTQTQVAAITTLANLVRRLLQSLIKEGIVDEFFTEGLDIDEVVATLDALGADAFTAGDRF